MFGNDHRAQFLCSRIEIIKKTCEGIRYHRTILRVEANAVDGAHKALDGCKQLAPEEARPRPPRTATPRC